MSSENSDNYIQEVREQENLSLSPGKKPGPLNEITREYTEEEIRPSSSREKNIWELKRVSEEVLRREENFDESATWTTIQQPWDISKKQAQDSWADDASNTDESSRWNWTKEQEEDYYKKHPNERLESIKIEADESSINYAEIFKGIKGKSIEEIVALIPEDAEGWDRTNRFKNPPMRAFEYSWIDPRDKGKPSYRKWNVRVHEPDSSLYAGENAKHNWTVRIKVGYDNLEKASGYVEYMDEFGNFHDALFAQGGGAYAREHIVNNTHIIIATPDQYVSPIDNPGHYGRRPQEG